MQKRDDDKVILEFKARQNRQIVAIAAAMFIILLAAVLYKRPDLLGLSGRTLFGLQAISIAAFLGFTAYNWRCPSCGKHLGGNIHRPRCGKCGGRLQ